MTNETKPVAWRVKDYADGWTVHRYEHEAHRAARNGNLIEPLYTRAPINRPSPEVGESALVERLRVMAGADGRITCMAEYNGGAVASSQSIAAALCADAADTITRLQAELAEARKERDELRWAIMGGEDAPGLLDTLSHEWVLEALAENRSALRWYATQAEAQRDAALAVAEDVASDLRVLSNDMANDGVAEKWWRPVYDEAVKLEALASLSPAKDEDPTHD